MYNLGSSDAECFLGCGTKQALFLSWLALADSSLLTRHQIHLENAKYSSDKRWFSVFSVLTAFYMKHSYAVHRLVKCVWRLLNYMWWYAC